MLGDIASPLRILSAEDIATGNPRPYGMPPFGQSLSEADIAALATYVRSAWGNSAAPVTALAVQRLR